MRLSESDKAKLGQPGEVLTIDLDSQQGKVVPWQKATRISADEGDHSGSPQVLAQVVDRSDPAMQEVEDYMVRTAPRVVKTSPQSKVTRLAALFIEEIRRRETAIGRPLTIADLSPQWVEALRVEVLRRDGFDLSDAMSLTTEHLTVAAQSWLQQGSNKVAENRGHVVRPF